MSLEKLQSAVVFHQREVVSAEGALAGAKDKQAKQVAIAAAVDADVEEAEAQVVAAVERLQAADEAAAAAASAAAEDDALSSSGAAAAQDATVKVEEN